MLPQFGYIVAQAGADSHLQQQQQRKSTLSSSSQLTKPYLPSNNTRLPSILAPNYNKTSIDWKDLPQQQQQLYNYNNNSSAYNNNNNSPHWQPELNSRIRESNDLIKEMDTEFWEECDEIYRDKLNSLQNEIHMIELGTHFAYTALISDLELKRERTINNAKLTQDYELSFIRDQYQLEMNNLKEDYEHEKYYVQDSILQSIEEKRKLIQEHKEQEFLTRTLFKEAYIKLNQMKRNTKKRAINQKKRDVPHILYATATVIEGEQLETDYILMKGGNPSKRQIKR